MSKAKQQARIRAARRVASLNEIARAAGFTSWSKLETAALHGEVTFVKRLSDQRTGTAVTGAVSIVMVDYDDPSVPIHVDHAD